MSDWISTKTASEMLGVSQRTIQNWVDSGHIPSEKTVGGHRRISKNELYKFSKSKLSSKKFKSGREGLLNILIVEDDPAMRRLYELNFETFDFPHDLCIVDNGFNALIELGRRSPDVLITDLKMPEFDGVKLIRKIEAIEDFKDMEIIVVTGMNAKDIMIAGGLPSRSVLQAKPVSFTILETLLMQSFAKITASD